MPNKGNFNLVCHGMMLFEEQKDCFYILMPEIKEHEFLYGTPKKVGMGCSPITSLKPLLPAYMPTTNPIKNARMDYELKGIASRKGDVLSSCRRGLLTLDGKKVKVLRHMKRIGIRVPRPNKIDLFRQLVPWLQASKIFDGVSGKPTVPYMTRAESGILKGARGPETFHEVVVFRYLNLDFGTKVTFGKLSYVIGKKAQSLCLYSQTENDYEGAMNGHRTGINDLVHGNADHQHPTFALSMVGYAAGAKDDPGGVEPCQFSSLTELLGHNFYNFEGGCPAAAVAL